MTRFVPLTIWSDKALLAEKNGHDQRVQKIYSESTFSGSMFPCDSEVISSATEGLFNPDSSFRDVQDLSLTSAYNTEY